MSKIAGRLKGEKQVDQVASPRLLTSLPRADFAVVHRLLEMCVDRCADSNFMQACMMRRVTRTSN